MYFCGFLKSVDLTEILKYIYEEKNQRKHQQKQYNVTKFNINKINKTQQVKNIRNMKEEETSRGLHQVQWYRCLELEGI